MTDPRYPTSPYGHPSTAPHAPFGDDGEHPALPRWMEHTAPVPRIGAPSGECAACAVLREEIESLRQAFAALSSRVDRVDQTARDTRRIVDRTVRTW